MSRQLSELETILQQLIAEHRRMLTHVVAQQAAMKVLDLKGMDTAANAQEASRLRIGALEQRRQLMVRQLAAVLKIDGELNIRRLAELNPHRGEVLLKLRDDLRAVVTQVAERTHVAGRLATAVLGHMNTVVRLLAGAVERAGLYTKNGVPQVSARIGVMEAVG